MFGGIILKDSEELFYIRQDYKKKSIKKIELVRAIEWLLDYIEDMELPIKFNKELEEVIYEWEAD